MTRIAQEPQDRSPLSPQALIQDVTLMEPVESVCSNERIAVREVPAACQPAQHDTVSQHAEEQGDDAAAKVFHDEGSGLPAGWPDPQTSKATRDTASQREAHPGAIQSASCGFGRMPPPIAQ
jgi:hypothetical protein